MVFAARLVLFSVPMHQKASFSPNHYESGTKKGRKLKNMNTLRIIRRPWSKLTILNELLSTHAQQSQPKSIPAKLQISNKSLARAVLSCGRRCITLRGDAENIDTPENPRIFLALLKLLAVYDNVLKSHLETPAMRCVTHLSPQTQNELIEVMSKHIILRGILDDLNAATYYSVLANEVTLHNDEHLAFCAQFVDEKKDVREEFLAFIKLERIAGEKIAGKILVFLKENNVPVTYMRYQGYDGASNMSYSTSGVKHG